MTVHPGITAYKPGMVYTQLDEKLIVNHSNQPAWENS